MKRVLWPLAIVIVPVILGAAGLFLIRQPPHSPAAPPQETATTRPTASPSPTITKAASSRPRTAHARRHRARSKPPRTGPWVVVSAYYRDIDAHRYARAWTLIDSGRATGQTYQQFVAGYVCTGAERPTRLSQSGHQVSFSLAVTNHCTGAAQHYTGTDTVLGGKIVAADVTPTG